MDYNKVINIVDLLDEMDRLADSLERFNEDVADGIADVADVVDMSVDIAWALYQAEEVIKALMFARTTKPDPELKCEMIWKRAVDI